MPGPTGQITMRYQAILPTVGDYGHKVPGEVFDVPDDSHTLRKMAGLEQRGIVMRYAQPTAVDRKAYTAYHNKMVIPTENK